jgi:hypothetical protein
VGGSAGAGATRVRPYLFYDVAVTICSVCYRKLEGKIVFEEGSVYLLKRGAPSTAPRRSWWPTTSSTTGAAARSS